MVAGLNEVCRSRPALPHFVNIRLCRALVDIEASETRLHVVQSLLLRDHPHLHLLLSQ